MDSRIRFLVPIGFSPQTDTIVEQSLNLARSYDAELNFLHVFDTTRSKSFFAKPEHEQEAKKKAQMKFQELLKNIEGSNTKNRISIKGKQVEGKTYEAIITEAKTIDANIIIMGTNRAGGLKNQFIGGNTMRVIKGSPCPVLTIRGKNHRKGCSNIVLPLDLTKDTTKKVNYAIDFAKAFGDTIIRAVSVLNTNNTEVLEKIISQMKSVKSEIEREGVECTAEIVKIVKGEDKFPRAIIAYANKVDADVIMIMTQQETNPTEFFIGSRAQTIINKADMPVMSFSPKINKALY